MPLDHSGATPGTLPITYAVLPAAGPRRGTVVILTGGPGQSGIPYAQLLEPVLTPLRRTHDVVLVDQRGTGGSGAVDCTEVEVEDCAKRLGDKRAFLTTAETARDVEDLRAALGSEKIVVLGVSYGTKVAGEYARRFPDRTAAVVLDSAVNVDGIDFVGLSRIEAMPRVLREVCSAGPCASTIKDAGAALFGAVARLQRGSLRGPVYVGHDGAKLWNGHDSITEERVLDTLQGSDTDPVVRADLPAALASLARGDAAPFIHILARQRDLVLRHQRPVVPPDASWSRFLATACLETKLPWSPDSDPATRTATKDAYLASLGAFAPFRPALAWQESVAELCTAWPATAPPEPVALAGPDVPVLVISGRDDLRTPFEDAQRIAAAYPHPTVLSVPGVGHSVLTSDASGCALHGLTSFLTARPVVPCKPAATALEASPYLPASIASPRRAAQLTLDSVRHDLRASKLMFGDYRRYEVAGTRGGVALIDRTALDLRAVLLFRGKPVSGRIDATGNGTIRVNGKPFSVRRFTVA